MEIVRIKAPCLEMADLGHLLIGMAKPWPVSGGLGYTIDDPVIIGHPDRKPDANNPFNFFALEYEFARARSILEMAFDQLVDDNLTRDDFVLDHHGQGLVAERGRHFDILEFGVSARVGDRLIQYESTIHFDITAHWQLNRR